MCIVTVDHANKLMHWIFRKIQGNCLIEALSPFIRYAETGEIVFTKITE